MQNFRTGALMLALGLMIGSTVSVVARRPLPASAGDAMPGMTMGAMHSKSVGDTEMNAAMDRMSAKMSATKLTGEQDRDFMLMMIPHHISAVDMARIELRRGSHPELKALARDVIRSQAREIGQMRAWLQTWYGRER